MKEIVELKKAMHSYDAFKKDRAHIILQSNKGKSIKQICQGLSKDRRTVARAIEEFNEKGLNALIRGKPKGATPKITKEQSARILEIANTDPRKLDLPFTTWSLQKLKKYLIQNEVVTSISHEWIRKLLQREGFRIKKSQRFQYSNDPEFSKKNF
ncbi:MAG: helix-turn-helix domain-containing protein [Candidatus Thermoplasmatota archaeon]